QLRPAMAEELLIGSTEPVHAAGLTGGRGRTILGASAVAPREDIARTADARHRIALRIAEIDHTRVGGQVPQGSLTQAPDQVIRIDKMIAHIEGTVALEHRDIPTGFAMDAEGIREPIDRAQRLVDVLNHNPAHALVNPAVEYAAEEFPDCVRRRRGDVRERGSRNEGEELKVGRTKAAEIVVDRIRLNRVAGMKHAQQIDENAPFLEERKGALHPRVRGPVIGASPERIVLVLRPVKAQTNGKAF